MNEVTRKNMIRENYLAKELHGDHAIHAAGKIVLWGAHRYHTPESVKELGGATGIGGVIIPDLIPDTNLHEMWECEIIIIPRRKYKSRPIGDGLGYSGHRIDQILTSNFGDPKRWGEKYYDNR